MSTKAVTPPSREEEQFCPVCKAAAKQRCINCKTVYYCTKEHQKVHWKDHSKDCPAFELAENSVVGRHYIATRKVKAGDLVLREEKPLIAVPNMLSEPICLNCYVVLSVSNAKPCKKCGWPLCLNCTKHGSECELTMNYLNAKIVINPWDFKTIVQMYNAVIVLRALALRDTDPKAYQRFLSFDDRCDDTENMELVPNFGSPRVAGHFVKHQMLMKGVEEDEIAKIIGIVMINGREVRVPNPHNAVFEKASYFEHSCQANCSKSFTDEGGIIIRAAVPIAKGDHITICYTEPLWGAFERRYTLAARYFFDCTCERCSDPTELGTMFNAIKCLKDNCTGYMLPKSFLVPKDMYPDFVCLKCKISTPGILVKEMLRLIYLEWDGIYQSVDEKEYKRFIEMNTKLLHENHFYITMARINLVLTIGYLKPRHSLARVSNELLVENITFCKKLIVLMKILMPEENRTRGTLLFHMYDALNAYYSKQLPSLAALPKMIKEVEKILAEAYNLLRYEPTTTAAGRIASEARLLLQQHGDVFRCSSVTPG